MSSLCYFFHHFKFLTQNNLAPGKEIKTKLVTLCWKSDEEKEQSTEIIRLPVPYQLPPKPYGTEGELD